NLSLAHPHCRVSVTDRRLPGLLPRCALHPRLSGRRSESGRPRLPHRGRSHQRRAHRRATPPVISLSPLWRPPVRCPLISFTFCSCTSLGATPSYARVLQIYVLSRILRAVVSSGFSFRPQSQAFAPRPRPDGDPRVANDQGGGPGT